MSDVLIKVMTMNPKREVVVEVKDLKSEQVPDYVEMVAKWCKQNTRMPVIVKLTPNISDIRQPARAALNGGADAVSLINTISSIVGVDF